MNERTERLYEAWQKAERDHPNAPRRKGYTARSTGQVHWRKSHRPGGVGTQMVANVQSETVDWGLEPIRKRTTDERVSDVAGRLYADALASYQACGKVVLARSVTDEIVRESWRFGAPVTQAQLEAMVAAELLPLFRQYAGMILARCERKFDANAPTHAPLIKIA